MPSIFFIMEGLSDYFVNPKGLLCYQGPGVTMIDVDMYLIPIMTMEGKFVKHLTSCKPALYSIYTDNQILFIAAKDRFGLFEGESYVRGMYSSEYILTKIDEIINSKYED